MVVLVSCAFLMFQSIPTSTFMSEVRHFAATLLENMSDTYVIHWNDHLIFIPAPGLMDIEIEHHEVNFPLET